MINMLAGIVNSEHLIQIADSGNKVNDGHGTFKKVYSDKVNAITSIEAATSVKEDAVKEPQFFTTKVEENKEGQKMLVLLTGYQVYRQINLDGTVVAQDPNLVDPVKVKQAYCLNEA